MGVLDQYHRSKYSSTDARSTAPTPTVQSKKSNLTLLTPSGSVPSTYLESVLAELSTLKFSPTLASNEYAGYIKIEGSSYGTPVPPNFIGPPTISTYLVTETGDFLITENNNNLIT